MLVIVTKLPLVVYSQKILEFAKTATAVVHIVGPLRKNDLFMINVFIIVSLTNVKMHCISVDRDGNIVSEKHMHAVF